MKIKKSFREFKIEKSSKNLELIKSRKNKILVKDGVLVWVLLRMKQKS